MRANLCFIFFLLWIQPVLCVASDIRPNIFWIVVEDMSPHFSCYGETTINTPHVDRLAEKGVRFSRAMVTGPVCSASRSALITGMYQTTIGAHQHRSSRGEHQVYLPGHVRPLPEIFRDAGYYCTNRRKTDYNFVYDGDLYDGRDWKDRSPGQPFFHQEQLSGGKLRSRLEVIEGLMEDVGPMVSPEAVVLPPYYPDHPDIRKDWAGYLSSVLYTDYQVGQILKDLEDEGVLENTIVLFITDHGISHARGKQFCYDEGIHVPFIVNGPGVASGVVREEVIPHIDMAATSLALAGIPIPAGMQGRDLFAEDYEARPFVISARDRCDETTDRIRSVRTERYKYIRNYHYQRPYLQPNRYKDAKLIIQTIRQLSEDNRLSPVQALITAETRPFEELYDLEQDPWEIRNLADNPEYRAILLRMRDNLDSWIVETRDQGEIPESKHVYDLEMDWNNNAKKDRPEQVEIMLRNIAQMEAWRDAGM